MTQERREIDNDKETGKTMMKMREEIGKTTTKMR